MLAGDGVLIDICKDDLPGIHQGVLVPLGGGKIIAGIPLPGGGANDLPVHHHIGVHLCRVQHGPDLFHIVLQPQLDLLRTAAALGIVLGVLPAQLHQAPEGGDLHLLLLRIALGQGQAHILRIVQQLRANHQHAQNQDQQKHHQLQHGQHVASQGSPLPHSASLPFPSLFLWGMPLSPAEKGRKHIPVSGHDLWIV